MAHMCTCGYQAEIVARAETDIFCWLIFCKHDSGGRVARAILEVRLGPFTGTHVGMTAVLHRQFDCSVNGFKIFGL